MSSFADDSEGIPSSDNICALLKEHANEISLLKDLVESSIPADRTDGIFCKYDNIFFLRYILSFGSASKAKEAVEYTLNFRKKPRWRKLIQQIKDDTYEENDFVKEMQKWQVASEMEGITVSGGFCVVIRGGLSDQATMIDRIPKEDMYTANMAYREMAFQKCDTVTRNTGQLAKQVKAEAENGKVRIRNVRKDIMDELKSLKDDGASEDDIKRAEAEVQKITDSSSVKIDELYVAKEKDIMTI